MIASEGCAPAPGAWVVGAGDVAACLRAVVGSATPPTLLDTRGTAAFLAGHLPGARRVRWDAFTGGPLPERGVLLADRDSLGSLLRSLGVSRERPVLVYGDPAGGWGEEGRVAWMLRALGHDRTAMVAGGWEALRRHGAPIALGPAGAATRGDFRPADTLRYAVDREAVRRALGTDSIVLVDTRQRREYRGETPYGEARGGHLPGAVHLHWRELTDGDGGLLPADSIRARLASIGVDEATTVYAYCSGGVRSGWMVAVLRELGYDARNYAGSTWEWSAGPAEAYPLVSAPEEDG